MEREEDLVRACAEGDPFAWRRFVDVTGGWVRRAVQGALRGPRASDVDDAVAEVYRQLLERDRALLRSFRPPFNLKAWLTIIARRTCLKSLRRRPAVALPPDVEAPARPDREDARALGALLEELDPEDRLVLDLFFRQEASYEHIAAVLGISAESVGKRKFRALERLRQLARDRGVRPDGDG